MKTWFGKIFGKEQKPPPAGGEAAVAPQMDAERTMLAETGRTVLASTDSQVINAAEAQAAAEWKVGDVILDLYEVKQVHEGGGMGLVHRVYHRDWKEELAVKSPRPNFFATQDQRENFVRECVTWIGLGLHPHIVTCYYVRLLGGIPRVFAEYVTGGTLKEWIETKQLYEGGLERALERILDLAIQSAWGLHHGHEKGVIHQDIKPANVMITAEGVVKVTDFGLAKARAMSGEAAVMEGQRSILLSSGGMTPAYCSPEQANKQPLSRKTDLWSWAVSVFEMFAGETPCKYGGQLAAEVLESFLKTGGVDTAIPKMPDGLADLLRACFQQVPEQRPKDLKWIVEQLKTIHRSALGRDYGREEGRMMEATADVLNNQGISYHDLGLASEAEQCFERALVADPHHMEATFNRGLLLWRKAKITGEQVIDDLEEAGKSHHGNARVNYLLGLVHLEQSDAESAMRVLTAADAAKSSEIGRALVTAREAFGKCGQCLHTFKGHSKDGDWEGGWVAISPNGQLGISGSYFENTFRLWDLPNGQCLHTLEGHSGGVMSVAFSPSGRWGLSGSGDKTLRLWDLTSGECLHTFDGHSGEVNSVAISPDGRWGLSGSNDKTLRLWDLASGKCLRTLKGHSGEVNSVAITPDGRCGLSGSNDKTLRLWDLAKGKCLRTFEGHVKAVASVAISPDGHWGLSGGWEEAPLQWDLASGRLLRTFEDEHTGVAISPDGRWCLSRGDQLYIWDLASGKCLRTFKGHSNGVISVALSADGRRALSADFSGDIRLWEVAMLGIRSSLAIVRPRRSSELLNQRNEFSRACEEAQAHLFQGKIGEALRSLSEARAIHGYERDDRAMSLLGRVACHCRRSGFRVGWHVRKIKAHSWAVNSVTISPDGRLGLSASNDGTLRLWDLGSGKCMRTFKDNAETVNSVAISPDGRWGLSGSGEPPDRLPLEVEINPDGHCGLSERGLSERGDYTVLLWDLASGECLRTFDGHSGEVTSVAMSSHGRWAISGSADKTLRLWDAASGECLRVFKGHSGKVNSVAISPDGRWAISASQDKTLRLWDVASGESLQVLKGRTKEVNSIAISPDGCWALAGCEDKTLRLWDLATRQCLRTFKGHLKGVKAVAISPDGNWGLSTDAGGTLRMWDLSSGQCLRVFAANLEFMESVAISPDGRWGLSGGESGTLHLWELDWEYEFPGWADWDEGARPHLSIFLTLHCPIGSEGISHIGKPAWNAEHFQGLINDLQDRGYGWLRPEGVRRQLEKMAAEWQGPPPMPWEQPS